MYLLGVCDLIVGYVDNEVLLENVVSRKKQIIPFLMTAAQNM